MDIYTLPNVKLIASGKQLHRHRKISLVLCDHLEWWDREGGREGVTRGKRFGDICICIADSLCYKAETNNTIVKQLYSNKHVKKKRCERGVKKKRCGRGVCVCVYMCVCVMEYYSATGKKTSSSL